MAASPIYWPTRDARLQMQAVGIAQQLLDGHLGDSTLRVAIIGTSSGPGWAAICRERKLDPRPASNNFLEVADNFLDFEEVIRLPRWYVNVRLSRIGLDCTVLLFISVHCHFNHRDKGGRIDSEPRKQVAHRLADGGCLSFQRLPHRRRGHIVKMLEKS